MLINCIDSKAFDDSLFTMILNTTKSLRIHAEIIWNTSNFYFINSMLEETSNQKFLCGTHSHCNLYMWNTGFHINGFIELINAVYANYQFVSVYEESMDDQKILEISSKLELLVKNTKLVSLEYVLISERQLLASKSTHLKIMSALRTNVMQGKITHHHQNLCGNIDECWKSIQLKQNAINDEEFEELAMLLIKPDTIAYFEEFNIEQCNLSELSINTLQNVLNHCVIKNLNLSGNSISNNEICNSILSDIYKDKKMLNPQIKIPLSILTTIYNSSLNKSTPKSCKSVFVTGPAKIGNVG